jgi:kumamolisin
MKMTVNKTYVDFPESQRYLKPRPHTGPADEALRDTDHRAVLRARRAIQHQDDIRLLTEFAVDNGLTVSEVDPARRLVKLSGPASKMQAAFGTTLGVYTDGKQQFRARTGVLRLP